MSVEDMEARGQQQLVASTKLPTDARGQFSDYEALGIVFGDVDPSDEIFRQATLPDGWQRKPTDHNMWTEIVDDRGLTRIEVFYKAAPYDRSAHMRLVQVGQDVVHRALRNDDYAIPWELLLPQEQRDAFAALAAEDEEDPPLFGGKERFEREHERLKVLWEEAERRALDNLRQWREVLNEG